MKIGLFLVLAAYSPYFVRSDESIDDYQFENSTTTDPTGGFNIVRYRRMRLPGFTNVKSAYQILFNTKNSFGEYITGNTTVITPFNRDGKHVVSYQVPQNSAGQNCVPAETLIQGEEALGDIQSLLDRGWVVNIPDHEGFKAAFGAGQLSGQVTLDSLKAVGDAELITDIPTPEIALWGYSGGAFATGWAAELAPQYAPGLKIYGAAIGGYIVDLDSTARSVNKGPQAGLAAAILVGLSNEFWDVATILEQNLKEDKVAELDKVRSQCSTANIAQFAGQDVFDLFKPGETILKNPTFEWRFSSGKLGKSAPPFPLLIYQGRKDEVVPYQGVDAVVNFYCSGGTPVRYVQGNDYDHAQMETGYRTKAIQWISGIFDGKASTNGCTYENITRDDTGPEKPDGTEPKTPDDTKPDDTKPDDTKPDDTSPDTPVAPVPNNPNPNTPTTPVPNTPNPNTPTTPVPNTPNPNTPVNPNPPGSVSTPSSGSTSTSTRVTSTLSTPSAVTTAPSAANLATTASVSYLLTAVLAMLCLLL